jgi:hypothetical protein
VAYGGWASTVQQTETEFGGCLTSISDPTLKRVVDDQTNNQIFLPHATLQMPSEQH